MRKITIQKVTKDYGNNKGIFDISFDIKEGEVFGFLGPNGAGKTTTIRHILGFVTPDSGTVMMDDRDCFEERHIVQRDIGYIPGETAFMDDMIGMEFIKFMAAYRGLKEMTRAEELITMFALDPRIKIKKMSKGMKQKIGIIVAFMHNPSVLILDEPTSGLDPIMQSTFVELIKQEKKKGKTILMSSHIFEEVEKTCDRVGIIKEGHLITVDDIKKLKENKTKKFTITFTSKEEVNSFKKEPISIVDSEENKVTVLVKNNINEIITVLGKYTIVDLEEEPMRLENIFMEYYGGLKND